MSAAARASDGTGAEGGGPGATAPLHVSAADLDDALAELLDTRNAMTRVLLGAARAPGGDDVP